MSIGRSTGTATGTSIAQDLARFGLAQPQAGGHLFKPVRLDSLEERDEREHPAFDLIGHRSLRGYVPFGRDGSKFRIGLLGRAAAQLHGRLVAVARRVHPADCHPVAGRITADYGGQVGR